MRFSAAIHPQQQLRRHAAAEFVRRLVAGQPQPKPEPEPARADELPQELDQRVRLIGEW